jgi:mono/diheme cytochrome c family protein
MRIHALLPIPFAALVLAGPCRAQQPAVDFQRQIRPIFEAACNKCHQGRNAKGGLRFDTADGAFRGGDSGEPAIRKGEPDKSLLMARIVSKDRDDVMPPEGDRLSTRQIELLRQWIREGASWSAR